MEESSSDSNICSVQQVQLVCEALMNSKQYERLERFLWALPAETHYNQMEIILIARAVLAFRKQNFQKLYHLMENNEFSKRYHRQLQILWRSAHYMEAELQRARPLGAVGKYRVRRKYPLPKTIWDGENMSYCFQDEARDVLNGAYMKTTYPTATEKVMLAEKANLTVTQVSNWFKNKRQRARSSTDKIHRETSVHQQQHEENGTHFRTSSEVTVKDKPIVLQPKPVTLSTLYNAKRYAMTHPYPFILPGFKNQSMQPTPYNWNSIPYNRPVHSRIYLRPNNLHKVVHQPYINYVHVPCTCNMNYKDRSRLSSL